jgi:hypothetical protein
LKTNSFYNILSIASLKSIQLEVNENEIISEGYNIEGRENVLRHAKKNKIIPFVAHLLSNLNIDKEYWSGIHSDYEKRNNEIITILDRIFYNLEKIDGIKIFVFENYGALLASNACIGCFASGDIDVYAGINKKKDISVVLAEEGFLPISSTPASETVGTSYFKSDIFDSGFGINVLWKPLSRKKLPFNIDINYLIDWSNLNNYSTTHIKLPSIDALTYLCLLHISVHSFVRSPSIRLYVDIDRLANMNPDWEKIAHFAQRDHTSTRIFTAILLSNKLLGTLYPAQLIINLKNKYKNIHRLVNMVYEEKKDCLIKEPTAFKVLLIEINSSDYNCLKSLMNIFFPGKEWIREYYLSNGGSLINGYFKHIKRLW